MEGLSQKLDSRSTSIIEQTLNVNGFTTRLQIKLITEKNLEMMFQGSDITMGAKNLLSYHIQLLRDESPLALAKSKKKSKTTDSIVSTVATEERDSSYDDSGESDISQSESKKVSTLSLSISLLLSCNILP